MPVTTPHALPAPAASCRRASARARRIAVALCAVLVASPALAQSTGARKEDTGCAQYGAGFQRVPGSNACVRTGVSVRTDAYGGNALGNAGSQFNATPSGSSSGSTPSNDPWKTTR